MDGRNLLYSGEMMSQSEQNVRNGGEMVLTQRTGEGKNLLFHFNCSLRRAIYVVGWGILILVILHMISVHEVLDLPAALICCCPLWSSASASTVTGVLAERCERGNLAGIIAMIFIQCG